MALLKLGAIITSISGKVGGQSFVNGSQGTYLKNIGNQSKTANTKQSIVRSNTSNLSKYWASITDAQRLTWSNPALPITYTNRVGEVKEYTGFQKFLLLNQGRILLDSSPRPDLPYLENMQIATYSITDDSILNMTIQSTDAINTMRYVLWASPPVSAGRTNVSNLLRKIATITDAQFNAGYDFTSDYNTVFTNLQGKQTIAIMAQSVAPTTGQKTDGQPILFFLTT